MAVYRQEGKLSKLDGEKRELRQEVYGRRSALNPASGPHVHTSKAGRGT